MNMNVTELDDVVEENLAADKPLVANWGDRKATGSVAEQILGVAATLKQVQRDLDQLQEEMVSRLNAIRKTLGSKA